jgi:hypothetical protein
VWKFQKILNWSDHKLTVSLNGTSYQGLDVLGDKCPCAPHQSLIWTKQPNLCPFADETLLALRRCKLGWNLFNCSLNLEKPSCTNRTLPRLISAKVFSIVTKEHLERATPVYLIQIVTCDQPSTLNVKLLTLVARLPKKKIRIRYSSHKWQDILPVKTIPWTKMHQKKTQIQSLSSYVK